MAPLAYVVPAGQGVADAAVMLGQKVPPVAFAETAAQSVAGAAAEVALVLTAVE